MIRLFLRLYGVLIATLAVSFMVQMQLMDYAWKQLSAGFDFRDRFRPTFHLLEEALSDVPPERWEARFAQLSAGFGLAAALEPLEKVAMSRGITPQQAAALAAGSIVSVDLESGGFRLFKRLRGSDRVAAVDFPGVRSKRIRMMTYAVNWSVEFGILALLVFFWVRPFWRDLLSLRAAACAVGEGRFDTAIRVGRYSALREFAQAFQAMAGRVALLLQSHRTLTSGVSHELRTPLARLRFSHSLAREEPTAEGKERYLSRMEADIAEIDELTTELLDYARLERGVPDIRLERVPAHAWLEDVLVEARDDLSAAPGLRLESRVGVEALRCEPRYMARAVINLVRNALRHARTTVAVSVSGEGDRTVIHVDDDGEGIPAHQRDRVFEPFERIDGSRSRASGGFGLGLAIVRQVARWHGGDAVISPSPLGGARVSIAW